MVEAEEVATEEVVVEAEDMAEKKAVMLIVTAGCVQCLTTGMAIAAAAPRQPCFGPYY